MLFLNKIKLKLQQKLSNINGYSKITIAILLIALLSLICMAIF